MKDVDELYPDGAPGSDKAVQNGCMCPVVDNCHGKGAYGVEGQYFINAMCKLHGQEKLWDMELQLK